MKTKKTKKAKKAKKAYIEMRVIDWKTVLSSIVLFPTLLLAGLAFFVVNFIRYNLKLLIYLIVCLIPILNLGIVTTDEFNNCFEIFDEFKIENIFQNLITIKRFEVKK